MKLLSKPLFQLLIVLLFAGLMQACGDDSSFTGPNFENVPPPFDTTQAVRDSTTEDGLKIYVIEEGNGPFEVIPRDEISVQFTGRTTDGEIFDSSFRRGLTTSSFRNLTPVTVTRSGQTYSPLIDGFRRGLLGMTEGEKRTIVIPPSLGYGESREGTNGYNLRSDTLIFDVELLRIF